MRQPWILVALAACAPDAPALGAPDDSGCTMVVWYADTDGDGRGDPEAPLVACEAGAVVGYADNADDCDDREADAWAGADEVPYDGVDNDCDPSTADDDLDGDGYPRADDCDDLDNDTHPGAVEIYDDEIDNDCDGDIDGGCGSAEGDLSFSYPMADDPYMAPATRQALVVIEGAGGVCSLRAVGADQGLTALLSLNQDCGASADIPASAQGWGAIYACLNVGASVAPGAVVGLYAETEDGTAYAEVTVVE